MTVHILRLFVSNEVISKDYPDYYAPIEVKVPFEFRNKKQTTNLNAISYTEAFQQVY